MDKETGFYTLKGYRLHSDGGITDAMEDYLEMICRCAGDEGEVRINRLAERLHVRPSSASKMVGKLKELELVDFEKYGRITPTPRGAAIGRALLRRHDILHRFFCRLNQTEDELEQVERVEHFIRPDTLDHLEILTRRLEAEANEAGREEGSH